MNQNQDITNVENSDAETLDDKKPDDYAGMYIRGHILITDIDSGEVLVRSEA